MSISSRCFFFAVQTVCMGTRCWTVGSRSAPPTPRRGCLTTAVRPVGTTSCPPRPPAPTVLLCQVRKNSIHDTMEFMSLLHCLVLFIDFIVTGLVSIVRKFIAWVRWFSELFLLLAWVIPVAAGGGGGLLLIVIIIVACCCCRKSPSERAELKYRPDAVKT